MDPARTFKESLTSRPELENSQGQKRKSPLTVSNANVRFWPIVLKSLFSSLLRLQLLLIRRNEGADFIRDV